MSEYPFFIGVLALLLALAWRIAGYYGIDRYLLPLLGTPWTGMLSHNRDVEVGHISSVPNR